MIIFLISFNHCKKVNNQERGRKKEEKKER